MLARHGYGVLLLIARTGHERRGIVRWAGDTDLLAGAEYLQGRDVDDAGSARSASPSEASSCSKCRSIAGDQGRRVGGAGGRVGEPMSRAAPALSSTSPC